MKQKKDKSPRIHQNSKMKNEITIRDRELTPKQIEFLQLMTDRDTKMVFISGPAGTSKTYLAVLALLKLLNTKKVSDIIYLRSAVESADSKIGFLPGEIEDKMGPYIQPLVDKLNELISTADVQNLTKEGRISSVPISFLRGLNWNAKGIIIDEAQNLTEAELITAMTRVGEFSKVFIIGDPDQADIKNKSGFFKTMAKFDDQESIENGVRVLKFTEDDIVRSGLVKFIIKKMKK